MAAARGWTSVFVDTESTFRPERLEEMAKARGIDPKAALDSVFCIRARDVKTQKGVLRRIGENAEVQGARLVVVDTVTKNFSLEFPGKEGTGKRQGALGSYLNRIALDAYFHRRVVILTNRVASVTRNGISKDVNLGGITMSRFVSKSIRLRREGHHVLVNVETPPSAAQPIACGLSERGFD
jgi:DNA repair protein RadA